MSRPTKLTKEVHQKIVSCIRRGAYPERAAEAAGVSAKTFRRWIERGRTAMRGAYRALYEAVFRAESHAEIELTLRVRKGARENPMTSLKLLERRFPERWSPYRKLAAHEQGPAATNHGIVVVTAEQLRAMLERNSSAGANGAGTAVSAAAEIDTQSSDEGTSS